MTSVTDNFNRTDENPIAGDWESCSGDLQISSNIAKGVSGVDFSMWKTSVDDFGDDQTVKAKVYVDGTFDKPGVCVRCDTSGNCYYGFVSGANLQINKLTTDTPGFLQSGAHSQTIAGTYDLELDVTDDDLVLTLYTTGTSTSLASISVTDTTFTTGQPGMMYDLGNVNASTIDDWEATDGAGSSISSSPSPSISSSPSPSISSSPSPSISSSPSPSISSSPSPSISSSPSPSISSSISSSPSPSPSPSISSSPSPSISSSISSSPSPSISSSISPSPSFSSSPSPEAEGGHFVSYEPILTESEWKAKYAPQTLKKPHKRRLRAKKKQALKPLPKIEEVKKKVERPTEETLKELSEVQEQVTSVQEAIDYLALYDAEQTFREKEAKDREEFMNQMQAAQELTVEIEKLKETVKKELEDFEDETLFLMIIS